MPRLGSKSAVAVPALSDKHTITQGGVDYSETNTQVLGLLAGGITNKIVTSNTTDSTSKDTGSIITEGGIGAEKSINVGGSVQVAGVPVAGFLSDGTPYYKKKLTGTILSSNIFVSITHGISNAATDEKIIGVTPLGRWTTPSVSMNGMSRSTSVVNITYYTYDDTELILYRGDTGEEVTFSVWVDYI